MVLNIGISSKNSSETDIDPKVENAILTINELVKANHKKLYLIFKVKD